MRPVGAWATPPRCFVYLLLFWKTTVASRKLYPVPPLPFALYGSTIYIHYRWLAYGSRDANSRIFPLSLVLRVLIMAGFTRGQTSQGLKKTAMRAPSKPRDPALRDRSESPMNPTGHSTASIMRGQRSPSIQPTAGLKRKERDFEHESGEETNIHVVVRCRGRNDREVKENSGVVVSTEGVRGKTVELSMGPNAMGNKAYHFDKVFSPAADQAIIYEDVVIPILNEVRLFPGCVLSCNHC